MKEFFTNWNPIARSLDLVEQAGSIIEDYRSQGYTLTLRQLYYQFVSRDIIDNNEKSYKNLGVLITNARLAGLISWRAIEDRTRGCKVPWVAEDPIEEIESLPRAIRFDQWARQESYVEVWVEKEALGNVIEKACYPYMVPHLACKGYLSASESWRSGKRFERAADNGKKCYLIHLGDHDPSGIDMTRDNDDRIQLLSNQSDVVVIRIALNMSQIKKYKPPPNPAKLTDSRAKKYIRKYGNKSWELDALEPAEIERLIKAEIKPLIDFDVWNEVKSKEAVVVKELQKLGDNWEGVQEFLEGIEDYE